MEEIEAKHAWRESMYCPKCDCGNYCIHEQLMPGTDEPWWVDCPNCGYEGRHSATRSGAINRWRRGR